MKHLLTIIILLSLLESCGFVHKTFDRKKENHQEKIHSEIDSSSKKTTDSSGNKAVDSSKLKKSEEKNESGVEIDFDSSSHNKVEISIDSNGKQVIKAEGKIKSVKTKKQQEKKTIDSTQFHSEGAATKHTTEQASVKKQEDKKQSGSSVTTRKRKTEFRIPWYAYLIGIIVLIIALVYLWKRYRYKIIAWFIQKRNPGSKVYYDQKIKGYQIIYKRKTNSS